MEKRVRHLRLDLSVEEAKHIQDHVDLEMRRKVLLAEADRASGKRYRELTESLPKDKAQALTIGPMFVGGDSADMDTFVVDVWKRPVTEENYRQVIEAFQVWYSWVAPDEYHLPRKPATLESGWFHQ
jgi:hypothetical protein